MLLIKKIIVRSKDHSGTMKATRPNVQYFAISNLIVQSQSKPARFPNTNWVSYLGLGTNLSYSWPGVVWELKEKDNNYIRALRT